MLVGLVHKLCSPGFSMYTFHNFCFISCCGLGSWYIIFDATSIRFFLALDVFFSFFVRCIELNVWVLVSIK